MAVTQRVYDCMGKKPKAIIPLATVPTTYDVDKIVTTADMKNGAYILAAQPTCPTKVTVTTTAVGTADTQGIITVVGTNLFDQAITDIITPVAGSTVTGTRYFKTITSVTGSGWVKDAVEKTTDSITVGVPAAGGIYAPGMAVTFVNVTGAMYVDPIDTAVADSTSILLMEGDAIQNMVIADTLSIISSAGGTYWALIFDV